MMEGEDNSLNSINQTYKIWKKHCPFLYNQVQTYPLSSCSQTVQFFTDHYLQNDWKITNMLVSTNSLAQNAINIISIALPTNHSVTDYSAYRQQPPNSDAVSPVATMGTQKLNITATISQASQIMRARINPHNESFIAAKTGGASPQLLVYDLRNKIQDLQNNVIKLSGHDQQGFGLCWHPIIDNKLASGSYDKKILAYDLQRGNEPYRGWTASDCVEDIKWSKFSPFILASAQKDEKICLWDNRSDNQKPTISRKAHSGQVYTVDFNRFNENLLLSGGQDNDICLWDLRNLSKKLHSFVGHNDAVNVAAWNPTKPMQFASGSSDRRVVLWDIERLNLNNQETNGNEILFIHGGHRSKVTDVAWGKQPYLLGSSEQNNTLQVWRMNEKIQGE